MSAITWTETIPSGTSFVGTTSGYLESVWTSISEGLSTSLFWDGSGGASSASRGVLLPGASKTFLGAQSASSAPNSQMTGRAFFASDTSRLLIYDSNATYVGGTPWLFEYGTPAAIPANPFVETSGYTTVSNVTTASASLVTVFSIGNIASGNTLPMAAFAYASSRSVLVRPVINRTIVPNTTNLVVEYLGTTGAGSSTTLYWTTIRRALGF